VPRALALVLGAVALCAYSAEAAAPELRVTRVIDGDTLALGNGQRVRLVQIDTPEVYFRGECYGRAASKEAATLLPAGTAVRLSVEPATDRVDDAGRLLRYVIRARDGLNINLQLVRIGAAAPYFYRGRRGRYAAQLEALALRARAQRLGLWGACPGTPYQPNQGVRTRPAAAPPPSPPPPPPRPLPPMPPAPPAPPPSGNCHPSYPTVCIPPPPPDLDCKDIPYRHFPVRHDVPDADPHGFDGNRDGEGCEI
jgi:endonuclease YncB( thermonuclease family)